MRIITSIGIIQDSGGGHDSMEYKWCTAAYLRSATYNFSFNRHQYFNECVESLDLDEEKHRLYLQSDFPG